MSFQMVFKAAKGWQNIIKGEELRMQKAMSNAVSVEAFRLSKQSKPDLRQGKLGLKAKTKYRNDSKDKRYSLRGQNKKPMAALAPGIVYKVDKKNLTASIGFLSFSKKWMFESADKNVNDYRILYTPDEIAKLHRKGIHLRKTTTSAQVPGRDIAGGIYLKNKNVIFQNIRSNFERKMAGERI